jgi:hypothetical protein
MQWRRQQQQQQWQGGGNDSGGNEARTLTSTFFKLFCKPLPHLPFLFVLTNVSFKSPSSNVSMSLSTSAPSLIIVNIIVKLFCIL